MPPRNTQARRDYQREYYRRRLATDPAFKARHYERTRATRQKHKAAVRTMVAEFKAEGCQLCGEKTLCCLAAHHRDETTKVFDIGNAARKTMPLVEVARELAKCICLCHNCHAKVHAGELALQGA
jgi:hypothetical protein